MGRILAIDYGLARIGLALSDELKMIPSPLPTLKAQQTMQETITQLLDLLAPYTIDLILIGMPYNMDGSKGAQAKLVDAFIAELAKATPIPIKTWDERLTSVQADRLMKEDNLSRKKRAQSVDSIASLLILQSYLATL